MVVKVAVHLDHEASGMTVEVCDEPKQNLLPAKVKPVELIAAQPLPQNFLGRPHLASKLFRTRHLALFNALAHDHICNRGNRLLPARGERRT
jgi:hypothetical protein